MAISTLYVRIASASLLLAVLAGCGSMGARHRQKQEDAEWAATAPVEQQKAPPPDGSIYHDMQNMELFNDARAHRIGDILTINLVEAMQASKKSETTTGKTDKNTINAPEILGHTLSVKGGNTARFQFELRQQLRRCGQQHAEQCADR
jgi:flagellar L-ring protein precursor FlgH